MRGKREATLCWLCHHAIKRAGNPCPWAMCGKPVDGWEAKPTVLTNCYSKGGHLTQQHTNSYCVYGCQLFRAG